LGDLGVDGEDNIETDFREIMCEDVNWDQLNQDGFQWWIL
jgi:hypothetical protein